MSMSPGYRYGIPMGAKSGFPTEEAKQDAAQKHATINTVINELDAMKDVAKILDGCPVDVQKRISAWVASRYGKSLTSLELLCDAIVNGFPVAGGGDNGVVSEQDSWV